MDKRSWPWKKKSAASLDSGESSPSHPSRYLEEDQSFSSMPQQQLKDKVKHLNERLLAADDLVKQHVKVAEEAVSGWEKSKDDYVSLKQQIDALAEQKHAADDRVLHLEGALQECTWQLRQVREEQEERIHEAIVKKTRDWDKLRSDLEVRLTDANQQLVQAGQQNTLLFKTVQEQAETIMELSLCRSQAEADIEMLQVRVEAFEKENAALKYEVVVLNKEVDIRNHEREMNKRSADVANKQHLEHVRKIGRLEGECQRLRVLVRKKLPGPGALAQMKQEVDGLDNDKVEIAKWRFGGRLPASPRTGLMEPTHKTDSVLCERLFTMEEETKMLKEALAKRNIELQAARLMYTRTADKLSMYEGQLSAMSHSQRSPRMSLLGRMHLTEASSVSLSVSKEPSQASMSEDGNDDDRSVADSWASALITELAQFPKEKLSQHHANNKALERIESLDDFIEVERLVSFSPRKQETRGAELDAHSDIGSRVDLSDQLCKKETELVAANTLCEEVSGKLAMVEEQLNMLRSKNAANELNMFSLQQRLSMIFEAEGEHDPQRILADVKNAVAASHYSSVDGLHDHVMKLSKISSPSQVGRCMSAGSTSREESLSGSEDAASKTCSSLDPGLTSAICKVVRLIEELALATAAQHSDTGHDEKSQLSVSALDTENDCQSNGMAIELDTCIKSFITTGNSFLHGKVELLQFMVELSSVLSQIRMVELIHVDNNQGETKGSLVVEAGDNVEAGSPVSNTRNLDGGIAPADEQLASLKIQHVIEIEEELRKIRAEKAGIESHMRAEFSRIAGLEDAYAQLKEEKSSLEDSLEEEKEKLETLKSQFQDAEQLVANLRVRLASAEISKNMVDEHLAGMAAAKAKVEAQLQACELETKEMHEKLEALEETLTQERTKNEYLETSYEAAQQQLQEAQSTCSYCGGSHDTDRSSKEQEIANAAEKLAECQHTILVLGRQLNDLAWTPDPPLSASDSTTDMANGDAGRSGSCLKQEDSSSVVDTVPDVTDDELISAARGMHSSGKKMLDLFGDDHEDYIQAIAQMPTSPHADADTRIVKYVPPKLAAKKKGTRSFAGIDLSKSLNLAPSSSPQKHGNSFSRFFSRSKNA